MKSETRVINIYNFLMAPLQTLSESVTMDYILSENKYIAKIEGESVDSPSIFLPSLRHLIIIAGAFSCRPAALPIIRNFVEIRVCRLEGGQRGTGARAGVVDIEIRR